MPSTVIAPPLPILRVLAACAMAFGLCACGTTGKATYAGAAAQQQRDAALIAASPETSPGATADTQSTYLKVVEQMQRDGLWFASLAHIDALEQRWGVSPASTRLRADALRQTGQVDESSKTYGKLMGTPLEGAGYHGLGLLAGTRSDFPQAVRMLEQAQRRSPTDGLLLNDLGYANLRAGRVAEARVPLMQAMQLEPDNMQVQVNVALYLQASGQPEAANALMESRSMPPATRAAILTAATELNAAVAPVASPVVAQVPATIAPAVLATAAAESSDAMPIQQLALKPAGWPRRIHVMVRPEAAPVEVTTTASNIDSTTTPSATGGLR